MKNKLNARQSYNNSSFVASFDPKKWEKILEIAYSSVVEGNNRALNIIWLDPKVFQDATLCSTTLNKSIIEEFKEQVSRDHNWNKRVRSFKSNRMIYNLIDRDFFICFKAIGKDDVIEGLPDSSRFEDTINGVDFSLNKEVLEQLSKLGVKGIPPILFVGFKRDGESILEVRFQHYVNGLPVIDFAFNEISQYSRSKAEKNNKNSSNDDLEENLEIELISTFSFV